ncbi:hypothetical protein N9R81_02205 [Flavobacteriales bacterium]|nr:hypothetical protein [Flavobacteriales bacterium]
MDKPQYQNVQGVPFKITGNWNEQSKLLKGKFSQLTDPDLKFEAGKEKELLEKLEIRLNKETDEVIDIIKKVQPGKN